MERRRTRVVTARWVTFLPLRQQADLDGQIVRVTSDVGWSVEHRPGPDAGVEGEGVFGFVDVAAGDVQDAVGLSPGPAQDQGGVGGPGDAVGAAPADLTSFKACD